MCQRTRGGGLLSLLNKVVTVLCIHPKTATFTLIKVIMFESVAHKLFTFLVLGRHLLKNHFCSLILPTSDMWVTGAAWPATLKTVLVTHPHRSSITCTCGDVTAAAKLNDPCTRKLRADLRWRISVTLICVCLPNALLWLVSLFLWQPPFDTSSV